MKSIETLKNIWKIEDLRNRILITVLFVAIYRFGSYVVLPGIDANMLTRLHEQTGEGLMSLLNMFSGGAFSNASIFALGIMPYISASIVIQLLAIAVPYFQKLQREGESGRRKINQYTRYLYFGVSGSCLFGEPEDDCWPGTECFSRLDLVYDYFYNHLGCGKYVYSLAW